MTDYASNSKKSKETPESQPEKVVEKVVEGTVEEKKPSLAKRMKGVFLGGEVKSAARYVGSDVLLPAARNLLVEAATQAVQRIVYGESRIPPRSPSGIQQAMGFSSRTTYNRPVRRDYIETQGYAHVPDQAQRPLSRRGGLEFSMSRREDASTVVERLGDLIDGYGVATVYDLKQLLGQGASPVDMRWGWTVLHDIEISQHRNGWLLDLPPADPIA